MQQQRSDFPEVGAGSTLAPTAHISRRRLLLHRYAKFVVAWIIFLIFLGGQVKSTESGLSVPDWPNTYGHFMFAFPWEKMVGGIFWEHLHRMIASFAGLFTFGLTFWVYRVDDRRWVKRTAAAASIAVLVQGLLGGLTVLFLLPAWLSSSHGTLAQIYLCLVVTVALATSRSWRDVVEKGSDSAGISLRSVALATTCIIFAQLIIGALMRHSEAGLAIPDFPTMFGSWVPPLTAERLAAANKELWKIDYPQMTLWQMIAHTLHRAWALVVSGMVVWTFVKVYREQRANSLLRRNAMLLVLLLVAQVSLGILTVLTQKQFTITSLHVMTGAATLATSLVLTIRTRHLLGDRTVSKAMYPAIVTDEVPGEVAA
jgi:cytochrome c oxidase assembly protein subunit 15